MKLVILSLLGVFCASFSFASALPSNYQTLTAFQKKNVLWKQVKETPYSLLPDIYSGIGIGLIISSLGTFSTLQVSFNREADEMPFGRRKVIHPFGSVAPVRWIAATDVPYTGIYQKGGYGLARLSIAGDPDLLGFTPGMALKMFVDHGPSVNLQVMYSLDGQGENQNFFQNRFTNDIAAPTNILLKPLVVLFSLVQNPPTYLPVNHFAEINPNGKVVQDPQSPYSLIFVPGDEVKGRFNGGGQREFREDLASLPERTAIYQIYAKKTKSARPQWIGTLVTEDQFVASEYEDQKLFFQHHRNP